MYQILVIVRSGDGPEFSAGASPAVHSQVISFEDRASADVGFSRLERWQKDCKDHTMIKECVRLYTPRDGLTSESDNADVVGLEELCPCSTWARVNSTRFWSEHHPNCEHYDLEGEVSSILNQLIDGIKKWSMEEDGIPDHFDETYQRALRMVGRSQV